MGLQARDVSRDFYTEVLVIGGGMGGTYALHQIRQLGLSVKLVEAGADFGGVWHWNRYPGARVDSEFPLYQLCIPEVYKSFNWSERFPDHAELREYFHHVDKRLDLRKDAIFNTIVEGVSWDGQWTCLTRNGMNITCKYLLLCTGSTYKRHIPDFKGLEKFGGILVHSATFPEGGIEVKGRRVGVIGSGATGVQIVQELAKEDCQLTAFIRTPNIALPMQQRKISIEEQKGLKSFYDALLKSGRVCRPGFPYNPPTKPFAQATPEEQEILFEELWQQGGFAFLLSNYVEYGADKDVNAVLYNFWAKKVRAKITDPVKRDIMAPLKQEHYFGIKRPSLEQDYYECLDRPNVEVVNLKTTPIVEVTEKGVMTTDKLHEFDVLILATGFDSMTGSLMDLSIKDKAGRLLQEKWQNGVETYLGLMIEGMPNMFMVYSPQAPTALSNGPPVVESQVDWICDAIKKMRAAEIESIEPQHDFAVKWRQDIQDMNAKTLHPFENSWYMGANIPGKVREQLVYLAGVDKYNLAIRHALENWEGFHINRK